MMNSMRLTWIKTLTLILVGDGEFDRDTEVVKVERNKYMNDI